MISMSAVECAVRVSNACKSYGNSFTPVLDHLNMSISKGSIYGLLGASGCGKTTLLSCIAGRHKLNTGELSVLGGVPGTKGSGVPGPRIGYMPQEVALVNEMSIKNTIYYFGWMFAMTKQQIASRLDFLADLLELQPVDRLVKNLSGGQQRRVSFAAALVQTPDLLILDEPTVGLDPVLRQSIWDYLVRVTRESSMTVIITTHYIEEATQADKVGLLRGGKLLAEEAPDQLISRYGCATLEEVFLRLSKKQEDGDPVDMRSNYLQDSPKVDFDERNSLTVSFTDSNDGRRELINDNHKVKVARPASTCKHRIKALLYKDIIAFIRNSAGLMFLFFFPLIQIVTFFIGVGNDLSGLHLGIVNEETSNCSAMLAHLRHTSGVSTVDTKYDGDCHFYGLSCLFVDKIDDGSVISVLYKDLHIAMIAAKRMDTHGTLHIPANFSALMERRRDDAANAADETLVNSEISAWLDMSNYVIGYQIKKHLYDKFEELMIDVAVACNVSSREMKIPMKFEPPVLGSNDLPFRKFMEPGIVITIAFFLSAMVTATVLTNDKTNGVWDRNLVAGATTGEILLSHCLCQTIPMVIQVSEILLIGFYMFGMTCQGNIIYAILIVGLQYIAGLTYGLLISAISNNTTEAIYFTIGAFLPSIFLSGTLWPLESAPQLVQIISLMSPSTWSTRALFNVLTRGWSFLHSQVWPGFAMPVAWILGQFAVTIFLLRK